MNACSLMETGLVSAMVTALMVWVGAGVTYVAILRRNRGGWGPVTGSLWLFKAGSLGEAVEPLRRRLLGLFALFVIVAIVTAVLSTTFSAACP